MFVLRVPLHNKYIRYDDDWDVTGSANDHFGTRSTSDVVNIQKNGPRLSAKNVQKFVVVIRIELSDHLHGNM